MMIRMNVYLTPKQMERLKLLSDDTGLSMAELIRRAMDQQYPPIPEPLTDEERTQKIRNEIIHGQTIQNPPGD